MTRPRESAYSRNLELIQGGALTLLILTHRIGETAKIGNDISVVVLGVKGRQCRIGIDAPKDIQVLREEIADQHRPKGDREAST